MDNSFASVHPELISEWSERNLLLTPYYIDLLEPHWVDYKDLVESYSWNGSHYYYPFRGNALPNCLIYDADRFSSLGIDNPKELYEKGEWDWDTFKQVMVDFVTNNPEALGGLQGLISDDIFISTGVPLISVENGKPVNNINNSKAVNNQEDEKLKNQDDGFAVVSVEGSVSYTLTAADASTIKSSDMVLMGYDITVKKFTVDSPASDTPDDTSNPADSEPDTGAVGDTNNPDDDKDSPNTGVEGVAVVAGLAVVAALGVVITKKRK